MVNIGPSSVRELLVETTVIDGICSRRLGVAVGVELGVGVALRLGVRVADGVRRVGVGVGVGSRSPGSAVGVGVGVGDGLGVGVCSMIGGAPGWTSRPVGRSTCQPIPPITTASTAAATAYSQRLPRTGG